MPVLIAVLVSVGAVWFGRRSPQPPPAIRSAAVTVGSASADTITVHVSGAVAAPGLVSVSREGRVADAVAAAGGALPEARLGSLNLAAPVRDGEQIDVPSPSPDGDPPAVTESGTVRVNVATPTELEVLPGVGPVLAARIAAHRDDHGPYGSVEDLLDVPGIGEGKLASLRDFVVVP